MNTLMRHILWSTAGAKVNAQVPWSIAQSPDDNSHLVILAWTGDEMSYRADKLVIDRHTDTQAHRRRRRQYPKAKTDLG